MGKGGHVWVQPGTQACYGGAPWWSTSIPPRCPPSPQETPGPTLLCFPCGPHACCRRWTSSCLTGIKRMSSLFFTTWMFSENEHFLPVLQICFGKWTPIPSREKVREPVWGLAPMSPPCLVLSDSLPQAADFLIEKRKGMMWTLQIL